jgi:hypothetical protein
MQYSLNVERLQEVALFCLYNALIYRIHLYMNIEPSKKGASLKGHYDEIFYCFFIEELF